jgi:galacturan 1,4-alpha-galacturonidase
MDAHNIMLTNFVYQGGDDCIAVKPRSYNIYAQNITCNGGNGIAIGSLGQYLEDSSVENVHVKDAQILTHNNDMEDGSYIKTWVGDLVPQTSYESNYLPRGGGWGVVRNILFENFVIHGAGIAAAITQDSGDNGTFKGTSKMQITNVAFVNFTGYTENGSGNRTASVSCSNVFPCYNIAFQGWGVGYGGSASTFNGTITNPTANATGTCGYITPGGVTGLNGKGC